MADAQRDVNMKLPALVRHRRAALLVSTALCATGTMLVTPRVAAQPAANAQPTGGVVVGGSVSIGHSANQTTINQSTQRGAIDWQTFNVGSRQSVQFNQPSSTSMTLNKVQGSNPSQIAGQINANGQIIIQNQSGVVFYQGSQVNTAGLMVSAATSSATATQAFLSGGKLVMDQAANPNAAVVNQGQITVKQAGLAALVAPQVVNSGVITARLGRVELAGGSRAALDLYGDGMLSIDVTGKVAQLPNGATALVTNSGVIVADGGTVRLTARAADGLVTTLVDAGGKIQANSVGSHVGTITLNGVGGSIRVEGQLDATGNTPGTTGGNIAVNPTGNVTVASGARIDASGQAGGGLVAIGTTLKRAAGGPSVTATHIAAGVSVQPNATIAANATVKGNGGRVTLLSTTSTDMAGAISAKGGPQGGNGGFVEVSGDKAFALTGMVDVSAPFGLPGTILLDPFDLTVIDAGLTIGTENSNFIQNGGTVFANDGLTGTPDTISNAVINSFQGNVELQAKNNLEVAGSITLFGGSLTLRAGNNLTIDTGIAIATNGGNVLFTAADKTIAGFNPAGSLTFNGTLTTTGTSYASVTMSAGTGGIILNGDITAGLLDLSATGAGVQQIGGTISVSNLQSSGGVVGTVSLTGGNFVGDIGGFSVTPPTPSGTADFLLNDLAQLFVSGPLTAPSGNVFLSSADPYGIVMVGPVTASGRVSLQTDSLSSDGGVVTAGTFELAPFTLNSELTLGSIGSGLSLDSLSGSGPAINAGLLRFGAVTLPGATSPTTTAGTITVGGTFDAQTLPVELDSLGAITEAAAPLINVSTLSGNGGVWTLDNTGNSIDALGNIAATSFTLIDNIGLAVNGALLGGTNVAITPNGTLGIAGTISGSAIDLTASSIGMTGLVTDGGSGTTNLVATSGAINETGTLIAGTLTGSAATTANLSGSGTSPNRIATLGNFSANGFTLTDGIGLAVNGTLLGGAGVTIGANGILAIPGTISGSAIDISASSIGITGAVTDGGTGRTNLVATSGAINETGTLIAGTLTGSAATTADLTGSNTSPNQIARLGNFSSAIGFTLIDGIGLTVNGALSGGVGVIINTNGTLAIPGAINGGLINLSASSIGITGAASGSVRTNLVATSGAINETGTLIAGTLTGSAATTANLTGSNTSPNRIRTLGNFSAAGFTLTDGIGLAVNGALSGGTNVTINANGALAIPGTISGSAINLSASSIGITGAVTDGGNGRTNLVATSGAINETGALIAGTLTGSAATTANLTGSNTSPNRVTRLGNFSANGFTLTDGIGLAVNGALSGGTGVTIDANGTLAIPGAISGSAINLSASSIGITGAVADGGNGRTNLVATSGAINETGTLIAGTLTGSAATTADLTGSNTSPNQIATLGNFSANGFTLTDGRALSLAGTLTSPNIALLAPTSQISFGDGATIVTGGTARPAGPITASLEPANGGPGTFVQAAGFSQIGSSRIVGIDGGPATLQISVTGNARFDQPLGLRANQTWLIVNLTNGSATGDVFVNALDLSYTQPGSSVLFGSINGNTTGGAAALGTIQPAIDSHYTFNGCIIEAAVCRPNTLSLYTSVLGSLYPFLPGSPKPPPALSGLVLVAQPVLPAPTGQLTDPDVVPPNISFLDY